MPADPLIDGGVSLDSCRFLTFVQSCAFQRHNYIEHLILKRNLACRHWLHLYFGKNSNFLDLGKGTNVLWFYSLH